MWKGMVPWESPVPISNPAPREPKPTAGVFRQGSGAQFNNATGEQASIDARGGNVGDVSYRNQTGRLLDRCQRQNDGPIRGSVAHNSRRRVVQLVPGG